MKNMHALLVTAATTLFAGAIFADTLELADGRLLEGDFVGSSNGIIMFNTGDDVEAFPEDEIIGLFFSAGVDTAAAEQQQDLNTISVPAGTRLVIRTSDTINSRSHGTGYRFRGQLESALVVGGVTVAPRGTVVHGQIADAQQSGRAVGRSALTTTWTDIMLDDVLYPISTGSMSAQTGGEGGRTIGRTARAAAIGGLIDGSSGARTGARVGAGASILTSGQSINIPRGTIVETTLQAPLDVRL